MLSPHLFRQTRYNLYTYDGRLVGDTFADNAHEAAAWGAANSTRRDPIAYAKIPPVGGR